VNVKLAGEMPATGIVPVPVRVTAMVGLAESFVAMASPADRAPAAAGLKVTLTVHRDPLAKLAPQVVVFEKSAAFAPVNVMLLMVSTPMP
jgi:hypothetical protein